MSKVIFYPVGNGDSCLIKLDNEKLFVFDYADLRNPADQYDRRIDLRAAFLDDIGWPKRKEVDVLAFTHGDNDHVSRCSEVFYMDHALKYQGPDRVKMKELWVPAAMIVEEGCEGDNRVLRAEARHRLRKGYGIRVFSRPAHLKGWLEAEGLTLADRQHLITDAGRLVPGFTLDGSGIEFFVHSPFAERDGDKLLDRNEKCLVMQAVIRAGGRDTRFIITADSIAEVWQKMVRITRLHKNDHRLAWDILKFPHHCSYLSMADDKGEYITTPTSEFEWFLNQGAPSAVMVSSSWEIPAGDTAQPPHVQTFRRYRQTANELGADIKVTMEHPTKSKPERLVISVDGRGAMVEKASPLAAAAVTSSMSPRVG